MNGNYSNNSPGAGDYNKGAQQPIPRPVDDDGSLILRDLFKSPASAAANWQCMYRDDFRNMQHRALAQMPMDGFPPFSASNDRRMGQAGRTNTNFGHVRKTVMEQCAPFNAIMESMDPLAYIPTRYGTDIERLWIEPILAEEWTRQMINWSRFQPLWQQTVHLYKFEGVAFELHEDEWNWQWIVKGLQDMKLPRRSPPDVEKLYVAACKVDELCPNLYKNILYPEVAKKLGWDPEMVKDCIMKAAPLSPIPTDFQEWGKLAKNLDIITSGTAPMVETIHTWAKELDQTVSHYVGRYDGAGQWLYKKLGKFQAMKHFMTLYAGGVGTNGDLHSIRGLGTYLFNAGVMMDRTLSAACDAVQQSSMSYLKLNGPSEDVYQSLPYRSVAPGLMVLNEGFEFMPQHTPNFKESLDPWYERVKSIFDSQGNDTMSSAGGQQGPYVSDKRTEAQVMLGNQMTEGDMGLFFSSKQEAFKEVIRRMSRKSYAPNEPGGREVWNMLNRLKARGVPLEAWYQVDWEAVEINRGVGRGSLQARRMMADALMGKYPYYDAKGQQVVLRNWTQAYSGARLAREIVPLDPGLRPPQDLENANLENSPLMSGDQLLIANIQVLGNQNHAVHLDSHVAALQRIFQATAAPTAAMPSAPQAQAPGPQINANQMFTQAAPLHAHAMEHLQALNQQSADYSKFKAILEQQNEAIENQGKRMAAEEQKQQMGGAQGQGQAPDGQPAPSQGEGTSAGDPATAAPTGAILNELINANATAKLEHQKAAAEAGQAELKAQHQELQNNKLKLELAHLTMQMQQTANTPTQ